MYIHTLANAARGSRSADAMYVTRRSRDTLRDLPFVFYNTGCPRSTVSLNRMTWDTLYAVKTYSFHDDRTPSTRREILCTTFTPLNFSMFFTCGGWKCGRINALARGNACRFRLRHLSAKIERDLSPTRISPLFSRHVTPASLTAKKKNNIYHLLSNMLLFFKV